MTQEEFQAALKSEYEREWRAGMSDASEEVNDRAIRTTMEEKDYARKTVQRLTTLRYRGPQEIHLPITTLEEK